MSGPRRQDGRLAPFVMGYRVRLLEQGYTPGTVRGMLKVLKSWLKRRWTRRARIRAGRCSFWHKSQPITAK